MLIAADQQPVSEGALNAYLFLCVLLCHSLGLLASLELAAHNTYLLRAILRKAVQQNALFSPPYNTKVTKAVCKHAVGNQWLPPKNLTARKTQATRAEMHEEYARDCKKASKTTSCSSSGRARPAGHRAIDPEAEARRRPCRPPIRIYLALSWIKSHLPTSLRASQQPLC